MMYKIIFILLIIDTPWKGVLDGASAFRFKMVSSQFLCVISFRVKQLTFKY